MNTGDKMTGFDPSPHRGFRVLCLGLATLHKRVEKAGLHDVAYLLHQSIEIIKNLGRSLRGVYTQKGGVVVDLTECRSLSILLSEEQVKAGLFSDRLVLLLRHDGHAENGPLSLVMKDFDPDWFPKRMATKYLGAMRKSKID